ncbi:uncharacterized protein L201_005745 [Kwoniella dendrophila CBS 6074]|uniref:Rab-GAP TBC domain-containing protein n=1 Tax=Kwoniella dendrophila CBS 6074 TaxID=1295534 RepID=A0AAX4K226_9TREE
MSNGLRQELGRLSIQQISSNNGNGNTYANRPRDSTIASEGEAVDIFNLYGSGTTESLDGSGPEDVKRDSWRSSQNSNGFTSNVDGSEMRDSTIGVAYGSPLKYQNDVNGARNEDGGERNRESEISWSGPMNMLSARNSQDNDEEILNGVQNDDERRRYSERSIGTPDISITEHINPNSNPNSNLSDHHHHHDNNQDLRKQSLVSSIASSSYQQHQHEDTSRLSPQRPKSTNSRRTSGSNNGIDITRRNGNGSNHSSASTNTSISEIGNKSQHSVAGSSQYPGEEDDAFMVRNTYARLEKEGVHGDGWDQGVERTRGGPSMSSGKRATVYPATKSSDIGEQERQYLASLDRYGFVNDPHRNRSENRIALIPSSPLKQIPKLPSKSPLEGKPKVEPNNSLIPSNDSGPSAKQPPSSPRLGGNEELKIKQKEIERVDKWGKMMSIKKRDKGGNISEWNWSSTTNIDKMNKRIYKGIPDRWRMAAWWTLAQDHENKGKGKAKSIEELQSDYRNTLDLPSTFDVQIDLDVPRTISGHTMFVTRYGAGQRNLWHVLHCFSQVCETCGYVQGMGPIAATLLCYFDPERTYALLVRLHDDYGMHDIFEPGFPGLLEAFYVQERLMEWLMPDVYQSFQRNMISSSSWGTKWYITLFVNTIPFSQQLRIWDALWLDGRDVMIITTLAILWSFRDLLSSPKATFESILSLLSSYFVIEDEDSLMRWIRKVINQSDIRTKMNQWRLDWHELVKQGKNHEALL